MENEWDWMVFLADETGMLPLAQRLRHLPEHTHALVVIESELGAEVPFLSPAHVTYVWVSKAENHGSLSQVLQLMDMPEGLGHCWLYGDKKKLYSWRQILMADHDFDREQVSLRPISSKIPQFSDQELMITCSQM